MAIRDQGAGVGNISLSGSDVRYDFGSGPVVIGTFVGGSSGIDPLIITLNASSDDASVEALMRNITFGNISDDPSTLGRNVQFVLTDGDGGVSNAATETINVAALNDEPSISFLAGDNLVYTEGDGPIVIEQGADAVVTDVDSTDFNSGNLTINIVSGNVPDEDILSIRNQGTGVGQIGFSASNVTFAGSLIGTATGGNSGSPLIVSLNTSADPTSVTALIRNVTYENSDTGDPTAGPKTVRFTINDGDGGTSNDNDVSLTLNSLNDVPEATSDPGDYTTVLSALSPLSYWRLGEGSGTAAADVGSLGNAGTYQGTTFGQVGAINGSADTAVRFNGTSDFVEVAHSAAYLLDNGTVQLWFNADSPVGGDLQHLFSKDASGFDTGGHLSIYLNASGQLEVRLQSASASYLTTSATTISAAIWHHVALTFGSTGMALYLDGQLVDTDTYTGGLGTTSGGAGNFEPIAIGAGTQNSGNLTVTPVSQLFTGVIDEVAILGAALDAATIQDLYAAGIQHYQLVHDTTLNVTSTEGCAR